MLPKFQKQQPFLFVQVPKKTIGRFQGGRGQGRGRGGRSGGKNNNGKKSNSNTTNQRKSIADYVFSVGKAAADYDTISKYLILHIRKTYQNGMTLEMPWILWKTQPSLHQY